MFGSFSIESPLGPDGRLGSVYRHTYCSARLQTLDHGAPVSIYTLSREMGHGSDEMVRRIYGHVGVARHRSEVVEYRVEQHAEALKDRLGAMGFVTRNDTTEEQGPEKEESHTALTDGGTQTSENGPGAIRTRDLLLRSPSLIASRRP